MITNKSIIPLTLPKHRSLMKKPSGLLKNSSFIRIDFISGYEETTITKLLPNFNPKMFVFHLLASSVNALCWPPHSLDIFLMYGKHPKRGHQNGPEIIMISA